MEISEGIIIAVITGVFAVLGNWIISRKDKADQITQQAVLNERMSNKLVEIVNAIQQIKNEDIPEMKHRLDEHNGYAEKFGDIQKDIAVIKTIINKGE